MFEPSAEPKFSLDQLVGIREPLTYLVRVAGENIEC